MAFYDLSKEKREELVATIKANILKELTDSQIKKITGYFADEDTYIRKSAYLSIGRIYFENKSLQPQVINCLDELFESDDFKIRQTVINSAGEIGKKEFEPVRHIFDIGLFDVHHSPRNAVIGSMKKMGEVNPKPVLAWAKEYSHHPDKEIRREVCHSLELRGRKYPQDILPILQELQYEKTARVRNTLIHVIGQVAYKKGCIQTVVEHLQHWENKQLVAEALEEIIDVHDRYSDFAVMTQDEARQYIAEHYNRNYTK
jgi:hypothetical protein